MSISDLRKRFEPGSPNEQGVKATPVPAPVPVGSPRDSEAAKLGKPPAPHLPAHVSDGTMSLGRRSVGSKSRSDVGAVVQSSNNALRRSMSPRSNDDAGLTLSDGAAPGAHQPPPRPPKARADSLVKSPPKGAKTTPATREKQLEDKILELQLSQLQLVEKLATYEQRANDEMRGSGGNGGGAAQERSASGNKSNDLLSKLRRKLDKNQKKKEALEVLEATEDMDTDFWSPKATRKKLRLDIDKLEVLHPLTKDVGGSLCRLYVCEIDGFVCVMKELDIAFARELNASLGKKAWFFIL